MKHNGVVIGPLYDFQGQRTAWKQTGILSLRAVRGSRTRDSTDQVVQDRKVPSQWGKKSRRTKFLMCIF